MKKYHLILFLLIVLYSCSITQRKYLPGYSIEWTAHNKQNIIHTRVNISQSYSNHILALNVPELIKQPVHINSVSPEITNTTSVKNNYKKTYLISSSTLTKHDQLALKDTALHKQDTIFNPKAKKAHTFGILSLLIPTFSVLLLVALQGTGLDPILITGELGLFSGIILAILAIIDGIVAIHEIKKDPVKYTGLKQARVGLILGFI